MNYELLKSAIAEAIKANGNEEITGPLLQSVLLTMVNTLGEGYQYGGIVNGAFIPQNTDTKLFYIAGGEGTYSNFGGLTVGRGEIAIFFKPAGFGWVKQSFILNANIGTQGALLYGAGTYATLPAKPTDGLRYFVYKDVEYSESHTKERQIYISSPDYQDGAWALYGVFLRVQMASNESSGGGIMPLLPSEQRIQELLTELRQTGFVLYSETVYDYDHLPSIPEDGGKYWILVDRVASNRKYRFIHISDPSVNSGAWHSMLALTRTDLGTSESSAAGSTPIVPSATKFDEELAKKASKESLEAKANKDGYYSTLIAGAAENLVGQDVQTAQFTRRVSGGSAEVGTGAALIKSIKGNTLVWNQLVRNGNFADGTTGWAKATADVWSVSGGELTLTKGQSGLGAIAISSVTSVDTTHRYYIAADLKINTSGLTMTLVFLTTSGTEGGNTPLSTSSTTYERLSGIVSPTDATNRLCLRAGTGSSPLGTNGCAKNVVCIDLTQMFGSGNEPSTAAEFEAMFPLSYYAYNTGSLLNLTATGLLTNGFNQWDEEWEVGTIDSGNGNNANSTVSLRSKNHNPCFGSTTYYIKTPVTSTIFYYDAGKAFISRSGGISNTTFTTPANCAYLRFVAANYVANYTTYKNDICINKSDPDKNGTYEPYWSETKALPITTATSGGVAIFPDGIKSAGTAHDRYYKSAGSDLFDKADGAIIKIDLGSVRWYYSGGTFYTDVMSNLAIQTSVLVPANIRCAKYTTVADGSLADGCISENINPRIRIKDSNYTDAATFKTAMSGVYAYAELATHTDYTLDTPFSAQYRVDNDGTETILPENGGTPTTAPFLADIQYAMNAVDTLRNLPKNYISKASMDSILTAFKTAGVITAYTLTWDSTNQKYNCTITR